jgi:hypothetical protein
MGYFSDMMLDGTICEGCGAHIKSPSDGVPRKCGHCRHDDSPAPSVKVKCSGCGKMVKASGLNDHMRDAHGLAGDTKGRKVFRVATLEANVKRLTEDLAYQKKRANALAGTVSAMLDVTLPANETKDDLILRIRTILQENPDRRADQLHREANRYRWIRARARVVNGDVAFPSVVAMKSCGASDKAQIDETIDMAIELETGRAQQIDAQEART